MATPEPISTCGQALFKAMDRDLPRTVPQELTTDDLHGKHDGFSQLPRPDGKSPVEKGPCRCSRFTVRCETFKTDVNEPVESGRCILVTINLVASSQSPYMH